MGSYRDDDAALETRAAELRERLAHLEAQIAAAQAEHAAKLARLPQGPPVWVSCLVAVLIVVVTAAIAGIGLLLLLGSIQRDD
jgi:hypothetical protein